ncbi:OB-fold domain-containing protein [Mycolicibacterium rufum]|uniref:OB-fold domain-containing protein n=1 Tax=Mycolicibacterium rufum TaxID=318424 RepID=A0A9X2XU48_9MYCO|nr:OB-fold domain-containing protein [Mycolicibacterium rufum]KGI69118.1 DNA-binding protein [Mycolicibacterium rufum]MCV7070006.1 OB-fold domain-containing protein [Mycolicibacterium rufum]ULP35302.1 OB-fold domain-containing protein [Mycolicibacterium rufum]
MSSTQRALAPEISTWPDDDPRLIGSTCGACGATTFPVQQRCPRCSAADMSQTLLPRRGTLVAWTTQGFPPGAPYKGPTGKDFVPFGVGLVQLGEGADAVVRVEGRLTENDPAKLQFGERLELTMIPFTTDEDGTEVVTFAFQPIDDKEAQA